MLRLLKALVQLAALALMLALIGGWFQSLHPALDSLSHFRLHFAALLFGASILLGLVKNREWMIAGLMTLLVSVVLTWPYLPMVDKYANTISFAQTSQSQNLRVVQMNLRFNNPTPEAAVVAIKAGKPDIALLQEVTRKTESVMSGLKDVLPYQLSCQIRGVGSVGILSRFPFVDQDLNRCARFFGFATVVIKAGDKRLTLATFHSRWPWPARQKQQIDSLADEFKALDAPLILAGDFNSAPWSAAVQRVAQLTGTQVAEGLLLTWAPRIPGFKSLFGGLLPLDQTLVSPGLAITSRENLGDGGSDHFPILSIINPGS